MQDRIRIIVQKAEPGTNTSWRQIHKVEITDDFTSVMVDDVMEALADRVNAAMGRI